MNKIHQQLFLAAYFSDLKKLDELLTNASELTLLLNIPPGYGDFGLKILPIPVPEILQMNLDFWYPIKDRTELVSPENKGINPQKIYSQTNECLKMLHHKFPNQFIEGIDYKKYIKFTFYLEADEEYIDKEEMLEYINDGCRKIDLDLINAGTKKDIPKLVELLQNGADINVNPFDKNTEQAMYDKVSADASLYSINCIYYYNHFVNSGYKKFSKPDIYNMLGDLYTASSSEKVCSIIDEFINKNEIK